jgi:hypothetical protein
MVEVGDVSITGNVTDDKDWFTSLVIAQLQV